MIKLPRIRFLLADDPGAGKAIVARLLLKELKIRGFVSRTLIIAPASILFQRQREKEDKFRLNFELIRSDLKAPKTRIMAVIGSERPSAIAVRDAELTRLFWIVILAEMPPPMSISLSKGGNVSLSKSDPGLSRILIGLGWDVRATDGSAFDLDANLFILGGNEKVRSELDFIFYNQPRSSDDSIERTGVGDGDDEAIKADLEKIPGEVTKLVVGVTILDADVRRQNFGMVRSAFIRVVNDGNGTEITRYDLSEDASTETAMIFGEVYRNASEWNFGAVGQGFAGGLGSLAAHFGVNIG